MNEPLPCPFCGASPKVGVRHNWYPEVDAHYVSCDCEMMPMTANHRTSAEAIAAWNVRAPREVQP